jgi:glycosyltransferase involved in cell wall biosynthesis
MPTDALADLSSASLGPAMELASRHARIVQAVRTLDWLASSGSTDLAMLARGREILTADLSALSGEEIRWLFATRALGVAKAPCDLLPDQGVLDRWPRLVDALECGPEHPAFLWAVALAPLHFGAHLLEPFLDLDRVPDVALVSYATWLAAPPTALMVPGEADRYARHLERLLTVPAEAEAAGPAALAWRSVLELCLERLDPVLLLQSGHPLDTILALRARLMDHQLAARMPHLKRDYRFPPQSRGDKPRIGFLVERIDAGIDSRLVQGLCAVLPRDRYRLHLYSLAEKPGAGPGAGRLLALFDHHQPLGGLDPVQAVAAVRGHDLDLALFAAPLLGGSGKAVEIALCRIARRQFSLAATTPVPGGLPFTSHIDASNLEPAGSADQLQVLGDPLCAMAGCLGAGHPEAVPAGPSPRHPVLADLRGRYPGLRIFASSLPWNRLPPELTRSWAAILGRVADSVLVLCAQPTPALYRLGEESVIRRMRDEFTASGISPDRLIVLEAASAEEQHAVFADTDVFLDGFVGCGAEVLALPLAAGTPCVVLGTAQPSASRSAAALHALGLSELVARSQGGYMALAIHLATVPERRAELAQRIRDALGRAPALAAGFPSMVERILAPSPRPAPPAVTADPDRRLRLLIPYRGLSRHWMGGMTYIINLVQSLDALPPDERPEIVLVNTLDEPTHPEIAALLAYDAVVGILPGALAPPLFKPSGNGLPYVRGETGRACRQWLEAEVDATFPVMFDEIDTVTSGRPIAWIPDFQQLHYPEFFPAHELAEREDYCRRIAGLTDTPLLLSSFSVREDFERFHAGSRSNLFVWPFCSALTADDGAGIDVCAKHRLPERFLYSPNQFWVHKDHMTLYRAIRILRDRGLPVTLACSGYRFDYRSAEVVPALDRFIADYDLHDAIRYVGVVPRAEQIDLFRHTAAIVSASRFEGWSTVVEDARALGRPMVLSDIATHAEQKRRESAVRPIFLFRTGDAEDLARVLAECWDAFPPGPDAGAEQAAAEAGRARMVAKGRAFLDIVRQAHW